MLPPSRFFFFFNATPTTAIYTLSLHDALPIFHSRRSNQARYSPPTAPVATPTGSCRGAKTRCATTSQVASRARSEEHTSELQSHSDLVCRLLLEKKKKKDKQHQDESCTAVRQL